MKRERVGSGGEGGGRGVGEGERGKLPKEMKEIYGKRRREEKGGKEVRKGDLARKK